MKNVLTALMLTGLVLSVGCHHKKKSATPDQAITPAPVMAPVAEPAPVEPMPDPDAPKGPAS